MSKQVIIPLKGSHAIKLFPMVYKTRVADTILWDGPDSFKEYESGLYEREKKVSAGELHMFTVIDKETCEIAGSADIRPEACGTFGDIGLWIGEKFHGRGLGIKVVQSLTKYGFETLGLKIIEGYVFVENISSRRVFEKIGYSFIGVAPDKVMKRGKEIEEWKFVLTKEDYEKINK
jgi:ribosomal-protein-alanine N-acetyltransferase